MRSRGREGESDVEEERGIREKMEDEEEEDSLLRRIFGQPRSLALVGVCSNERNRVAASSEREQEERV